MKTALEYPKVVREMWACFEAYKRLGFSPEYIFFVPSGNRLGVLLELDHKRRHGIDCGLLYVGWDADCSAFMDNVNAFDQAELQSIWEDSAAKNNSAELILTLEKKGLPPPCAMN